MIIFFIVILILVTFICYRSKICNSCKEKPSNSPIEPYLITRKRDTLHSTANDDSGYVTYDELMNYNHQYQIPLRGLPLLN